LENAKGANYPREEPGAYKKEKRKGDPAVIVYRMSVIRRKREGRKSRIREGKEDCTKSVRTKCE